MKIFMIILSCFIVSSMANAAGIHRWVDDNGNVHYSDSPPKDNAAKKLKTPATTPNAVDPDKQFRGYGLSLSDAIESGDAEAVLGAIRRNSEVSNSHVAQAVKAGHVEVVKVLLNEREAIFAKVMPAPEDVARNIKIVVEQNMAAAVRADRDQIVQLLIDKGAAINSRSGAQSYLTSAVSQYAHATVEVLLKNGAKVRESNDVLNIAAEHDDVRSLEMLLESDPTLKNEVSKKSNGGLTGAALFAAAGKGNVDSVMLLIEYGAKVNSEHIYGYTPLSIASRKEDSARHQSVAQRLRDSGAKK